MANATVPLGDFVLLVDVTVAINVTSWLVTALLGEVRIEVELNAPAAAIGDAVVADAGPWVTVLGSVSLTATLITWPTSAEVSPYCWPLAPETGTQPVPLTVQRLQLKLRLAPAGGGITDHSGDPVKVWPSAAEPPIDGARRIGKMTGVGPERPESSRTLIVKPTSSADGVYVDAVAPGIAGHALDGALQRCHSKLVEVVCESARDCPCSNFPPISAIAGAARVPVTTRVSSASVAASDARRARDRRRWRLSPSDNKRSSKLLESAKSAI